MGLPFYVFTDFCALSFIFQISTFIECRCREVSNSAFFLWKSRIQISAYRLAVLPDALLHVLRFLQADVRVVH
jgi:hypothetical protein